jgi:hypothetical protein
MQFRSLAERALADGAIAADEILALRREGWSNSVIDADEADALFVLNDRLAAPSPEWSDFFIEALSEFIVNGCGPRGYVDDARADWLIERIDADGEIKSLSELELLVTVLEKALGAPEDLKAYALDQIGRAVLTGEGPTRRGEPLRAGQINATEAQLLRRTIFAAGSDRPGAVSRKEAELLFRLKDASLGGSNAPEWKQLFVQGVGNYLQAFGGSEPLSHDRAAELEAFMNETAGSIGGFLSRMARSDPRAGFAALFAGEDQAGSHAGAVETARAIDPREREWLDAQMAANGEIDQYDRALLEFLAEG